MIGTTVGQYTILAELGHGGMGSVYKALDTNIDRTVALKFLNSNFENNPELLERFRSEARVQAGLNHPNIAMLYTFLVIDHRAVMVMEYIEGETLLQRVERAGRLQPEEAVSLFRQALCGVGAAHKRHIVHRDLKPANLMVNGEGVVKVMDFGIAKVAGAKGMTKTNMTMGTSWYMAPEQVLGQPVDTRTDVYSMGVTLYELLTAQVPFEGTSEFEIQRAHVQTMPALPSLYNPQIPEFVTAAVMRSLAKNPAERFQTAEEFFEALDPSKAHRETVFDPPRDPARQVHGQMPQGRRSTVAEMTPPGGNPSPWQQGPQQQPQKVAQGYAGQQPYGQPMQPGFQGQPMQGQPYGQPQQYGQPQYAAAQREPKAKSGKGGMIAAMAVVAVLALGGGGYVVFHHAPDDEAKKTDHHTTAGTGQNGTLAGDTSAPAGSDTTNTGTAGNAAPPMGTAGAKVSKGTTLPPVTHHTNTTADPFNVIAGDPSKVKIPPSVIPPAPITRPPTTGAAGQELSGSWVGAYVDPVSQANTAVRLSLQETNSQVSGTLHYVTAAAASGECTVSPKPYNESHKLLVLVFTACTGDRPPYFNVPTVFNNVSPTDKQIGGHPIMIQQSVSAKLHR